MQLLLLIFAFGTVAAAAIFEIPGDLFLQPKERVEDSQEVASQPFEDFFPPVLDVPQVIVEPQEQASAVLADDGYHYKTLRRIKHRHRRDVNELPYNGNLSPIKQYQIVVEPQEDTLQRTTFLSDQPSYEYLPPLKQHQIVVEPQDFEVYKSSVQGDQYIKENLAPLKQHQIVVEPQDFATQSTAFQTYKQANEYLQPLKEHQIVVEPQDFAAFHSKKSAKEDLNPLKQHQIVGEPQDFITQSTAFVANQHTKEFLPSLKEHQIIVEPQDFVTHSTAFRNDQSTKESLNPLKQHQILVEPQELTSQSTPFVAHQHTKEFLSALQQHKITAQPLAIDIRSADDLQAKKPITGSQPTYQQTESIRVATEPWNEYQPPVLETPHTSYESDQQDTAILAADGYHYKTGYRQRRDVIELPSNEYLPPLTQYQIVVEPQQVVPQESAALADDGYRYKVVRHKKYRQRRA